MQIYSIFFLTSLLHTKFASFEIFIWPPEPNVVHGWDFSQNVAKKVVYLDPHTCFNPIVLQQHAKSDKELKFIRDRMWPFIKSAKCAKESKVNYFRKMLKTDFRNYMHECARNGCAARKKCESAVGSRWVCVIWPRWVWSNDWCSGGMLMNKILLTSVGTFSNEVRRATITNNYTHIRKVLHFQEIMRSFTLKVLFGNRSCFKLVVERLMRFL